MFNVLEQSPYPVYDIDEVVVSEIDEIQEIDERLENQLLFGNQRFIRNHQGWVADLASSQRPSTPPQLQTNKNLFHELKDELKLAFNNFCKIVMMLILILKEVLLFVCTIAPIASLMFSISVVFAIIFVILTG